jgi:hypothetical protein
MLCFIYWMCSCGVLLPIRNDVVFHLLNVFLWCVVAYSSKTGFYFRIGCRILIPCDRITHPFWFDPTACHRRFSGKWSCLAEVYWRWSYEVVVVFIPVRVALLGCFWGILYFTFWIIIFVEGLMLFILK